MECKTCGYRLWNLKARKCPECGTSFLPSDFEFVCNAVQFQCSHCAQPYYGTGTSGHLEPMEFDCVSCGQHIHMDEMVVFPTSGVTEDRTRIERAPWLERKQIGFWRGWWRTMIRSISDPARLGRSVPPESSTIAAFGYYLLTQTIFLIFGAGPLVLLLGFAMGAGFNTGSGGGGGAVAGVLVGAGGVLMAIVLGMIGSLISVLIWGALAHAILFLTGGAPNSIGRTYQALCYSVGTTFLLAVPCIGPYCGSYLVWIWWTVVSCVLMAQMQSVGGLRATFAVVTPILVGIGLVVGGYVLVIVTMINSASFIGGAGGFGGVQVLAETQTVLSAVQNYAIDEGEYPGHALVLLPHTELETVDLVAMHTMTAESDVPAGDETLGDFDTFSRSVRIEIAVEVAEALPQNTIAHRLGDFVFTWHGLDPAGSDPNLWVVLFSPDPDTNSRVWNQTIIVGMQDGQVVEIPSGAWSTLLANQNALREAAGLAPLPDHWTITHSAPAVDDR